MSPYTIKDVHMAIFGEKFYRMLNELNPWQQSLFALTLAHRQSPNFLLYAEVTENHEAKKDFLDILGTMWEFHTDKENHINLEKLLETLEQHIPDIDDDSPYGAYPALDACISLSQAINAITNHFGDEAEHASSASICTVAKYLEFTEEAVYEDDELYEKPLIAEEMDYQINLLERISKSRRSPEFTRLLKKECEEMECSNIGITAD